MCAKARTVWRCQTCGAGAPRWMGRCTECGEFGTFVEEVEGAAAASSARPAARPVPLSSAVADEAPRVPTGIAELDRVLGGGLVSGSLVLLGGEPGVGKSTLLLQAADSLAAGGRSVLYVCGEESPQQVGGRAQRLGLSADGVALLAEIDIVAVEGLVRASPPDVLVLDSIQTAYDPDLSGAPGSVGQVRSCTARLLRIAKDLDVTTLIVGHVTKDGSIAGPRVLEHMVDAVLSFEGDRDHLVRIVRAAKNRFGSVSEIGLFEMRERGLVPVASPSAALLAERGEAVPGSVAMVALEGSRPMAVEIQALVSPTYLPVPRRLATGIDSARLSQVIAVLERRAGLSFGGHDVHVAVAGGLRVPEPAVDLPLAIALGSALKDVAVPLHLAAFGELGLTGRVRPVPQPTTRAREAARRGLGTVIGRFPGRDEPVPGAQLVDVDTIAASLDIVL